MVDRAVERGGHGFSVHLGVWPCHAGRGSNLSVVPVSAGAVGGIDFLLDGHDVNIVRQPAHRHPVWSVTVFCQADSGAEG